MSQQPMANSNVAACATHNLLADEFAEVFIAGTNTQIVTLTPVSAPRRRTPTTYRAWVFDFDTLGSEIVILHADTLLQVRE